MQEPKWENPELYALCMKHGAVIAKREKITQLAILDMYDEMLGLITKTKSDLDLLLKFAKDIASNYDHESDAHRYDNGACRVCKAVEIIAKVEGGVNE